MNQWNYDLIVLTETHFDHSILDSEIFPSHYTVFRNDRKTNGCHGGGMLIAVRDCIPATLRATRQCESELLFIDLLFSYKTRITLGVIYQPPEGDTKLKYVMYDTPNVPCKHYIPSCLSSSRIYRMILLGNVNTMESQLKAYK